MTLHKYDFEADKLFTNAIVLPLSRCFFLSMCSKRIEEDVVGFLPAAVVNCFIFFSDSWDITSECYRKQEGKGGETLSVVTAPKHWIRHRGPRRYLALCSQSVSFVYVVKRWRTPRDVNHRKCRKRRGWLKKEWEQPKISCIGYANTVVSWFHMEMFRFLRTSNHTQQVQIPLDNHYRIMYNRQLYGVGVSVMKSYVEKSEIPCKNYWFNAWASRQRNFVLSPLHVPRSIPLATACAYYTRTHEHAACEFRMMYMNEHRTRSLTRNPYSWLSSVCYLRINMGPQLERRFPGSCSFL